jgi:glycosyltransferase involved in cell wall biosynthesis
VKIAIINRHISDFIGGSEMQCDNIASELIQQGDHAVYIAVNGNKLKDYATSYSVVPVGQNAEEIVSAIASVNPDIVYWRMNKFGFYKVVKSIHSMNIPVVYAISHINDTKKIHHHFRIHSVKTALKAVKMIFQNIVNYEGFRYVNAITTLNSDLLGKVPVVRQVVVTNCIDDSQDTFSWPRPFVVWVATIKAAKRPEKFVELAKVFEDSGIDFLMIGPVIDHGYEWISGGEVPKNFHYMGQKSPTQVNGIIQESLFLVHTCLPEGFGNNFIQAWFCGRPTLSLGYDPQGLIKSLKIGEDAGDDWESFVSHTRRYIESAELRAESGERARHFAENTFSCFRTVTDLKDLFGAVLKERVRALQ